MARWKSAWQRAITEWIAREARTQKDLSEQSGVSRAAISKVVTGQQTDFSDDAAERLAKAMGIEILDGQPVQPAKGAAAVAETVDEDDAAPAMLPTAAPDVVLLPFKALAVDGLNPRSATSPGYTKEALAELAESIAVEGLLQNLVVKPADRKGMHAIVAGERRSRAIELLVGAGRWDPDAPIVPCRIVAGDEARLRAVALLENLQRENLTPLEEAEGLDALTRLDPERYTVQHLAEHVVHKTSRFVQQRLAIARKLSQKAKALLVEGKITVEGARHLTMAPKKQQDAIAKNIDADAEEPVPAGTLAEIVTEDWFDASHALFPLDAFKGEIVDDEEGKRWIVDGDAFWKAQNEAVQAKAKALREERAWVTVLEPRKWFNSFDYTVSRAKGRAGTGCVLDVQSGGEVRVHDGLVKRGLGEQPAPERGRSAKPKAKATKAANGQAAVDTGPPFTRVAIIYARRAKSRALQDAVMQRAIADGGLMAMRLAIVGLLGWGGKVAIREGELDGDSRVQGPLVRAELAWLAGALPRKQAQGRRRAADDDDHDDNRRELPPDGEDEPGQGEPVKTPYVGDLDIAATWQWLMDRSAVEIVRIFSALVASRCGYQCGFKPQAMHDAFDIALADHAGLDMRAAWRPDADWFEKAKRPRLEAMAAGIGDVPPAKTGKALRESLAEIFTANREGPAERWFPPDLEVLDEATLQQRLAATPAAAAKPGKPAGRGKRGAAAGEEVSP
jgi:ParB/RepB/Spo0J family partition protein